MAEQLLQTNTVLLCISRKSNDSLDTQASAVGARCEQWTLDLAQPISVASKLQHWLAALDAASFQSATLINNAGVIPRAGPINEAELEDLSNAMRVGLEAPLLLSAAFLRATQAWAMPRRLLNISSGLGRRAMAGCASYCAAKAGLDHFSRATALDEARRPHGAKVVSLAPGVIDTDMQVQLRQSDPAAFPDRTYFLDLKARRELTSATEAARRVLNYLNRSDFGTNPVADVREN